MLTQCITCQIGMLTGGPQCRDRHPLCRLSIGQIQPAAVIAEREKITGLMVSEEKSFKGTDGWNPMMDSKKDDGLVLYVPFNII